ncbi:MAG: hypothetical protein NC342_07400 [Pseudoflavonifractor sp.]|nr:hypothetical protein [Alloprevotella sp.]MCM1117344.1 hypothetical protein [Pseudoflavonifractor sp.]
MKRKLIRLMLWLVALVAMGYAIMLALDTQGSLSPGKDTGAPVASVPIISAQPVTVHVAGDIAMKLDTGSDVSCITVDDLERLRSMGAQIHERYLPIMGRGTDGHFKIAAKRLVIDLPLEYYERPDTIDADMTPKRRPELDNCLRGAEFVLIDGPGEVSGIGIDILRHFTLEYIFDADLLRIHTVNPEGYEPFSSIHFSRWPSHIPWPGRRYYIDLDVDHITDSYFIDTGLRRAALKLPYSRAQMSRRRQHEDSLVSYLGVFHAKTDNAWVECGNRAGSQMAYYCDNEEESYSVNPFNFFTQDVLIDFRTDSIALHPYVALPKRHFVGADTITAPSQQK